MFIKLVFHLQIWNIYIGVRTHFDWTKDSYIGSSLYLFYKQDVVSSKEIKFEIISFHKTRNDAEIREIELVNEEYISRKISLKYQKDFSDFI